MFLLSIAVKWVAILLCTEEALISNNDLQTGHSDRLFFGEVFLVPYREILG
jgi:hypothetical protein